MFFALNTFMWQPRFTAAHLPLMGHVASLGGDLVEIQCPDLRGFPTDAVARELNRIGIGCTFSTSSRDPERSLIAADASARRAGVADLRHAIGVARDLGASVICGPLYAPAWWFTGVRATADQWRWAAEGFALLAEDLARAGVTPAIEPINRFETFVLTTAAQGVALCEEIGCDRIGLLLDTAHMAIEEKDPVAAIRASARWLRHLHLPENDRGTPGTGTIDWPGLFAALVDIDYAGGCAIESFPFPDPRFAMPTRTWRDLARSVDSLALLGRRRCAATVWDARSSGAHAPFTRRAVRSRGGRAPESGRNGARPRESARHFARSATARSSARTSRNAPDRTPSDP